MLTCHMLETDTSHLAKHRHKEVLADFVQYRWKRPPQRLMHHRNSHQ